MMTRIELEQAEAVFHCLPRIADSLESIAKSLEILCKQKDNRDYSGMGPGGEDD